ncbi:MAG: tRNA glutamyl-Q(34) synthetase GluQRS [Hyphomicrobiales bacterium]|nr:tRNA glutamyl-Q(34) synthetase GluQRS [Hyphomicrobiales bacterium]
MAQPGKDSLWRFAPSPNGYLHLGHAFSALSNEAAAQKSGGRLLLRIEDIDSTRCRPHFEQAIYEDLAWLGLAWEQPVRRQSAHRADYADGLDRLKRAGLVYPCFCTRSDIARAAGENAPRDPDGARLYPGTCRALSAHERAARLARGDKAAWRIDMAKALAGRPPLAWLEHGAPHAAEPALWGDALIARKDIATSYHLAVVVDDAVQGVSDVMRGADLLQATALHRLLQDKLALPAPRYWHHALLRDESDAKLSKSRLSKSLRDWRAEGASPQDIRRMLGF